MNYQEIISELEKMKITAQILASQFEDFEYTGHNYLEIDGEEISYDTVFTFVKNRLGGMEFITIAEENEYTSVVVYFEDHDVYIKIDGYYSSYSGLTFNENSMKECKPVQEMVTIYKPI